MATCKNKQTLDMSAQELVALASSLAIALSQNFEMSELCTLRLFFSTLTSNLSLIEYQTKACRPRKEGNDKTGEK